MTTTLLSYPREWKFFAKGNANAIYRYQGSEEYFQQRVLRLRLSKPSENYISTLELNDFVKSHCEKYFPENIIKSELVRLSEDFLSQLETQNFKLMVSEKYGFLLDDMLFGNFKSYDLSKNCKLHVKFEEQNNPESISSVILELKPKWLYNNDTNYCRNCSLSQLRKLDRHFCPLDFLSESTIERGLDDLFSKVPKEIFSITEADGHFKLRNLLRNYFSHPNNIFQILKSLQVLKTSSDWICNVKSKEDVSEQLLFVMTMRDVGIFLKFEKSLQKESNDHLENKIIDGNVKYITSSFIYDLDLKPRGKYEHWRNTDLALQTYRNSYDENWRLCTVASQEHSKGK
ncbi:hypothetical protein JCM33374_g196 [Metschnikowia sp. JCM 33374]|nr:hypothetical protein JCM33374_g196 [Metschnikowia sp. JCM 33374]